jgi:hypothetical protein
MTIDQSFDISASQERLQHYQETFNHKHTETNHDEATLPLEEGREVC